MNYDLLNYWMKSVKLYIIVILLVSVVFIARLYRQEKQEYQRNRQNYDIEQRHERDRLQILTKKEFKTYYRDFAAPLKNYGVKPGQIENIVKVSYRYKDTLIPEYVLKYRDTLIEVFDTVFFTGISNFEVESKCNTVKGVIIGDTLLIESIETTDKLLISLYKEKRKCVFKKRKIKAIAISECKGDTLTVLNNLKIKN